MMRMRHALPCFQEIHFLEGGSHAPLFLGKIDFLEKREGTRGGNQMMRRGGNMISALAGGM